MNNQQDILTIIARHLMHAVEPLREAFGDEEKFKGLLYLLGWEADGLPQEYVELSVSIVEGLEMVENLGEGSVEVSEITALIAKIKDIYDRIQSISTAPPGVDAPAFLAEIGERLFEFLLTEYLSSQHPTQYNLLSALDVIEMENLDTASNKHAYVRTKFKWSEIPEILKDPLSIVQRIYGWGTSELDSSNIFNHLSGLLYGLGFPVNLIEVEDELALEYGEAEELSFTRQPRGIKIPFYYTELGDTPLEFSIEILELPASNGKLPGLVIQPGIPSEIPFDFTLGNEVDMHIRVGSDIGSRFGIIIRPGELAVKYPFQDAASFPSAGFKITIDHHPAQPRLLIGSQDGIRLEMQGGIIGMEVISVSGDFEVKGLSEIKKLTLILAPGKGDGFIQKILGDNETRVDIPLGIDWSSKTGFGFRGSMNFEIALFPHLSLGPIDITQFQLSLGVPTDPKPKIRVDTSLNIQGDLGPLKFVVEEIGLRLLTTFESGNLGPLNVDLGFKPPNGVGLAIDTGVVKGGGYLYFDRDKEEYAGALELVFSNFVTLKAIGLITTRMPDNSTGFSLLIIITAEFGSGIQLGLGFTLLGVGGLLGLNRTLRVQPLLEGVRTGAVQSVMFPTNVIENATRIISDLRTFFPPEEGKFLIGPMAKLGWGTPPLISLSLGLIIEIPPGNVTMLGVLKAALPTEGAPIIVLQVNFLGRIEFDKQRAFFFASLFESRVAFMTIEGEMGLLLAWGADANFLISVGGFHPRFKPPPLPFPSPKRIAVYILNEPNARIGVMGYFGVTSNTVQFGARADMFFGFSDLSIEGHYGLDALIQFSPFYFIVQISAAVSLKAFGVGVFSVRLRGALEGPAPWRVNGTACVSVLFFEVCADVDVTWGERRNTTLPPIQVMPLLTGEFEKLENWTAALPGANRLLVSLRKLDTTADLVLHPVGTLRISQRAVPLNLTIDKVGNQKPSDAKKFSLNVVSSGLAKKGDRDELFAMAQFQEMDDTTKLTKPAYELEPGGVELSVSGEQLNSSKLVKRIVRYETVILDTNYKRFAKRFFAFVGSLFSHFLRGSAVTRSVFSRNYQQQLHPFEEKIQVPPATFTVAFNSNNQAFSTGATGFTSEAMAREFMQQQTAENPSLAISLHVIPDYEVRRAA